MSQGGSVGEQIRCGSIELQMYVLYTLLTVSPDLQISKGQLVYVYLQVRIGGYRLPTDLGIGQFRELKVHEVRRVLDKGAQANPYL